MPALDGQNSDLTDRMQRQARNPAPDSGDTYVLDEVEYLVRSTTVTWYDQDKSIAWVELETPQRTWPPH